MTKDSKPKSKGFSALDTHQFERIRSKGLGIEEAATYLCLLISTDQSNVTSTGGINSIMEYSGLTRAEAKRAVQRLEQHGLLRRLEVERKRARTAPRYSLPIHDTRKPLATLEREVVEAIEAGLQPKATGQTNAAHRAKAKGYLEKGPEGWSLAKHTNEVAFIPNSFVRAKEGRSPLARLVNHGELGPLMLAAELYQLQNLMDERGVPPSVIRSYFSSNASASIGQHRLHLLELGRSYKDPKTGQETSATQAYEPSRLRDYKQDRFWPDLKVLEAAHIVEWAVYSANGKPSGEYGYNRPQRPLGVLRNGRHVLHTPESIPAFAAYLINLHAAVSENITKSLPQLIAEWQENSPIIVLENRSVAHVEGVGILRMTHRAQTQNASVWYRDLCKECDEALSFIEQTAQSVSPQAAEMVEKVRSVGNLADAISM